jgi:hypothetical protein
MEMPVKTAFGVSERAASTATGREAELERTAAAFGLSAAVTILFNTGLAWVKDATPALNDLMKAVSGHHWRTHGIVDVVVFVVLGYAFLTLDSVKTITSRMIVGLAASAVIAGAGLAGWFFLF